VPTTTSQPGPLRLALVDDYEVVVAGLAHMFDEYRDRVRVVELAAREPVTVDVDVALFDTFAQPEADAGDIEVVIANPHARRVAVYTWSFQPHLIEVALRKGACGYLSKALPAADLVHALERIHSGAIVVSPPSQAQDETVGLDWPGRTEGLSDREAEIVALIIQGLSNNEIAAMTYLSVNTVKSYLRTAYRKIGVTSRTKAALWGIEHGFRLEGRRLDTWRRPD